jgi:hypothetical protein
MRDRDATEDYAIPGDVLGEDSYRLTTKRTNNTQETGQWPKHINEVTITALRRVASVV